MLVQCNALVPLLLDALFLDPENPRKDMDERLRAGIQCDGAECFLQLALFEPGKELLEQHAEALDALRALVGGAALTEEARLSASSALAAVEGPAPGPGPDPGDEKHVMVSCASACLSLAVARADVPCFWCSDQWDVQPTIKRLVASLKKRGYVVWFGETADAHVSPINVRLCSFVCRTRRPGEHEGLRGRRVSTHR